MASIPEATATGGSPNVTRHRHKAKGRTPPLRTRSFVGRVLAGGRARLLRPRAGEVVASLVAWSWVANSGCSSASPACLGQDLGLFCAESDCPELPSPISGAELPAEEAIGACGSYIVWYSAETTGFFRYYSATSMELVGVVEYADFPAYCGEYSASYGEDVDCSVECLLAGSLGSRMPCPDSAW